MKSVCSFQNCAWFLCKCILLRNCPFCLCILFPFYGFNPVLDSVKLWLDYYTIAVNIYVCWGCNILHIRLDTSICLSWVYGKRVGDYLCSNIPSFISMVSRKLKFTLLYHVPYLVKLDFITVDLHCLVVLITIMYDIELSG